MVSQSSQEAMQFAIRCFEHIKSTPVCPLPRLAQLLQQATLSSPAEKDPFKNEFAVKTCRYMYIHVYIHVYTCIYMIQIIGRGGGRSVPTNLDIYIYIHVYIQCACIYTCIYMYIYIYDTNYREGVHVYIYNYLIYNYLTCRHMCVLLSEARRVSNYAQYCVGRLLVDIHRLHPAKSVSAVQIAICNQATKEKAAYYRRLVEECSQLGCTECSTAKDSDGRTSTQRTSPCELTQRTCRLKDASFENFTTTFLDQCRELATLPARSPLVCSSDSQSQARDLAGKARRLEGDILAQKLPRLTTGVVPVFALADGRSAVEAVQYVDGDGGFLVCELFPGLTDYLRECSIAIPTQELESHNYTLLPFREAYHDAMELGHVYSIECDVLDSSTLTGIYAMPCERKKWGHDALVAARRHLAQAVRLWIVPNAPDRSRQRLVVEIFSLSVGERLPKSTGVRLIESGLSYPTDGAPPRYRQAWSNGAEGLHRFEELSAQETLCPWTLKSAFGTGSSSVRAEWESTTGAKLSCEVSNSTDRLNECNVLILKSLLPGAGLGLFLRPTPPSSPNALVIPEGRLICVYSRTPTTTNVDEMASTDYLMEVQAGRNRIRFNPEQFNGEEMGRFINQGGLLEGVRALCRACDRASGMTSFASGGVRDVILQHCNVTYKLERYSTLNVIALKKLTSTRHPQELLSNYDIEYWLRYVALKYEALDSDSELVRCVLWTLLSEHSAYDGDVNTSTIPENVVEQYREMDCPLQQQPQRRRH